MSQDRILCEVASCYFWDQANKCNAKSIYVVNNSQTSPSMEIGSIGGAYQAKSSEQTACKTFKPHS